MTVSQQAVSTPRVSSGMKIEPYRPRIGALVSGIDLAQPLDDGDGGRAEAGAMGDEKREAIGVRRRVGCDLRALGGDGRPCR